MIIYSCFTKDCLPLLLKQEYKENPELIGSLFKFQNPDIMAISNRIDLCVSYLKHSQTLESIPNYFNFTKEQMEKLGDELPKLWQNESFIFKYLEKLMPSKVSFYLMNNELEEIADECYEIALDFALKHEKCKMQQYRKAMILLNYLKFKREQHVCYIHHNDLSLCSQVTKYHICFSE